MSVLPFPLVRNRRYIRRHAERAADFHREAGERYIRRLLVQHVETMAARQIPAPVIEAEARALDIALHVELARIDAAEGRLG